MIRRVLSYNKNWIKFNYCKKNKPEVIIEFDEDYDKNNKIENDSLNSNVEINQNEFYFKPKDYISFDENGLCLLAKNDKSKETRTKQICYFLLGGITMFFLYKVYKKYKESKYLRMLGYSCLFGFSYMSFKYNKSLLKMEIKKIFLNKCGKKVLIINAIPIYGLKYFDIKKIKPLENYVEKFFFWKKGFGLNINGTNYFLPKDINIYHKEVLKEITQGNYISVNDYQDIIIEK